MAEQTLSKTQANPQNDKQMESILSFFQEDDIQPFDADYQNRFLKVFISDKDGFPDRIIDIVQADYFDSYQKILLDYELKFFTQYKEIARFSTLKDLINEQEKGLNKDHLLGLIEKIEKTPIENMEHVKKSSYKYFKERSVRNCIFQLVVDWQKHNYDSMKTNLEKALRAGEPKDVGHNYLSDIEKRMRGDHRQPISSMLTLDKYIGGGLSQGEMGIVLAPTGGGKSMMLVKFACTAFLIGKKVLYYTLELSEAAVGNRIDACINQLPLKEVWSFSDVIRERADEIGKNGGDLIIKEFTSGQASINTLMAHVKNLQANEGFVPDIIFIDYGDLLKPLDNFSEKRHSLDSIYIAIRGMASELNIPIWNAAQTNRTGMDQEEISLSSIGESLGNARAADIVLGVGRTSEDKKANLARIGVLKNRNGSDGFHLQANFNTTKIFIEVQEIDSTAVVDNKKEDKKNNYNKTNKKSEKTQDTTVDDLNTILLSQKMNK